MHKLHCECIRSGTWDPAHSIQHSRANRLLILRPVFMSRAAPQASFSTPLLRQSRRIDGRSKERASENQSEDTQSPFGRIPVPTYGSYVINDLRLRPNRRRVEIPFVLAVVPSLRRLLKGKNGSARTQVAVCIEMLSGLCARRGPLAGFRSTVP
ncbi:hypothetical protein SISSUDRAFT_570279 [Sistotremastrum suecicum HHB10207 ss-3]|uniref:Uncharacterized protein n=1 Tax=Sistotremastrum suecicum HHB10207 ss-3 TaxID=1314776 RepID=A0A166EQN2_9AGAM|nr:hypothetical protein SISSUDRAFT_570279 [Sistotremastrum suecicum HHB10207 ss-3]